MRKGNVGSLTIMHTDEPHPACAPGGHGGTTCANQGYFCAPNHLNQPLAELISAGA